VRRKLPVAAMALVRQVSGASPSYVVMLQAP